jgi:hypothetical protein
MILRILLIIMIVTGAIINSGCSSLKDLPVLPVRILTSDNGIETIESEKGLIQRFEIEGFTVIFNPREMRITIIPNTGKNAN